MTTTSPSGRWDRLAADLAAAGIQASIDEQPYCETVRGRVRHGVNSSIMLKHPDGGTVEVHDAWWRQNPDTWIGWYVYRADAAGIERGRRPRLTKKRSEVVSDVRAALRQP